jgi:hypothetical protein
LLAADDAPSVMAILKSVSADGSRTLSSAEIHEQVRLHLEELRSDGEDLLERGRLVDLTPKLQINVPLYWYHWNLELPLARQITKTITAHAHKVLTGLD